MRKDWIVGSVTLSAVLGGLMAAGPVGAASQNKQVDRITCEEFLALNPDDQQRIAYWVDGYQVAKGEAAVGSVAFDNRSSPDWSAHSPEWAAVVSFHALARRLRAARPPACQPQTCAAISSLPTRRLVCRALDTPASRRAPRSTTRRWPG